MNLTSEMYSSFRSVFHALKLNDCINRYYIRIEFNAERRTAFYLALILGSFGLVLVAGFLFKMVLLNYNVQPTQAQVSIL